MPNISCIFCRYCNFCVSCDYCISCRYCDSCYDCKLCEECSESSSLPPGSRYVLRNVQLTRDEYYTRLNS